MHSSSKVFLVTEAFLSANADEDGIFINNYGKDIYVDGLLVPRNYSIGIVVGSVIIIPSQDIRL
jgi:hypothetical protein